MYKDNIILGEYLYISKDKAGWSTIYLSGNTILLFSGIYCGI